MMDCDLCGLPVDTTTAPFLLTSMAGGGTGWRHTHHVTVDVLTDEHRDRVWFDRDGDLWGWYARTGDDSGAWACWTPGDSEAAFWGDWTDLSEHGPFTEVRRAT